MERMVGERIGEIDRPALQGASSAFWERFHDREYGDLAEFASFGPESGLMNRLTIEEIADLADVSRSTVSRVLNNHPSVRPSVRERVQQVIQENRYTPRAAARSLASRRTNVVGL